MSYEKPPLTQEQIERMSKDSKQKKIEELKRSGEIPTEISPKHYQQNLKINIEAAKDEHPEYSK